MAPPKLADAALAERVAAARSADGFYTDPVGPVGYDPNATVVCLVCGTAGKPYENGLRHDTCVYFHVGCPKSRRGIAVARAI